ncbi:MAG: hypothetical protein KBT48_11950 [Firmicutes bacterium]|nr:hypothetical protein [Bacillota bacterium]
MIIILSLLLLIWAMLYSATRFMHNYRIESQYKDRCEATVVKMTLRTPKKKKEVKAYDVKLQYVINGKVGHSEIVVPYVKADEFEVGTKHQIRYAVSPNGAVHIASDSDTFKKLMIVHGIAIAVEFIVFFIIWWKI